MHDQNVLRYTKKSSFSPNTNRNDQYFWIRVILVIFKLIGLAPLSIVRPSMENKLEKRSFEIMTSAQFAYSRVGNLYNMFLVILLLSINFVTLPQIYSADYPFKSKLSFAIELSVAICYDATAFAIWLSLCTNQNTMVTALHYMTKVDSSLVYLSGGRTAESSWCYFLLLYLLSIVLCTAIAVTDQFCYDTPAIIFINNSIPIIIIYWLIIQYVSVLKLIENRLEALCRAFLNRSVSFTRQTSNSPFLDDIYINKNDYPKMITVRRTHTVLYKITCKVSDLYSLPILLAIAVSSFSLICNAYFLFMPLLVVQTPPKFICTTFNAILSMAGVSLPIIMLTAGVNRTMAKMRKIADATHTVLERSTTSQEDKVELQQFSLKLLLPNDQFFTAYRLFSLDGTLLHSIFSMVVTYLIILGQLQLSTSVEDNIDASATDTRN